MTVICAAGPYTVESDLDYEPLDDFLGLVRDEKPDVLMMVSFEFAAPSRIHFVLIYFPALLGLEC